MSEETFSLHNGHFVAPSFYDSLYPLGWLELFSFLLPADVLQLPAAAFEVVNVEEEAVLVTLLLFCPN